MGYSLVVLGPFCHCVTFDVAEGDDGDGDSGGKGDHGPKHDP